MSYEIRNDKLLREAYEAGRRDALIEQNLEVPDGGMAVQASPGWTHPDDYTQDELMDRWRRELNSDPNFRPGGGRAPYFPYGDPIMKKYKIGGMRWDGKRWVMYNRSGKVVLYYYPGGPNHNPGWYTTPNPGFSGQPNPGIPQQPVWPNYNTTPSGTPGIRRIG